MTVKISVGPPVLTINKGSTFMVTDYGGEIDPLAAQGVFADDTRFVSTYRLWIDGLPWRKVSSAPVSYHAARLYLTNPTIRRPDLASPHLSPDNRPQEIAAGTLTLTLDRSVDEGVREELEIVNHGLDAARFLLELEVASDFADLFEVKTATWRVREGIQTEWHPADQRLTTTYKNRDFQRRFTYQASASDPAPAFGNGRLRFAIQLEPARAGECGAKYGWSMTARSGDLSARRGRRGVGRARSPSGMNGG